MACLRRDAALPIVADQNDARVYRRNHGTRKAFYIIHCGIIDILQSYGIMKQIEAMGKSLAHDGPSVSVSPPPFYGRRFRVYMTERVFKPSEEVGTEVCPRP